MKRIVKKIGAAALALAVVLGTTPVMGFAQTETPPAVTAPQAAETWQLYLS